MAVALLGAGCRPGHHVAPPSAAGSIRSPSTAGTIASPTTAGSIGSPHAFVLGRAAPDGRWLFYCQARQDTDGDGAVRAGVGNHGLVGDRFAPYLWYRDREWALDGFLDASASGRHVLVRMAGKVWLIDTETDVRVELPVAGEAAPLSFATQAAFDPSGKRLVYARADARLAAIGVRDLDAGSERVLDAGVGRVWRVWFDGDGEHVWADVVRTDTDGDGELTLPAAETNLSVGSCQASAASSTWGGWHGDAPVHFASFDGKTMSEQPGGLVFFGARLLARTPDGALVLTDGRTARTVAPATCKAVTWHVDRGRDRIFYTCAGEARLQEIEIDHVGDVPIVTTRLWSPLFVYEHGASRPLDVAMDAGDLDTFDRSGYIDHTETGDRFDFATGAPYVAPATPNNLVAEHGGKGLIILRSGQPCAVELATGRRRCFDGPERVDPSFYGSQTLRAGPVVLTPMGEGRGALIDLDRERVLGFVADRRRVVAVASDGRVLLGPPGDFGVTLGPLQWTQLH